MAFNDSVLPVSFSCGRVDVDRRQAAIIIELLTMEAPIFIHMETCRVRHVAGPFLNGRYEVLCVAIAQIRVVSDATFTDDFAVWYLDASSIMQNYQFLPWGGVEAEIHCNGVSKFSGS